MYSEIELNFQTSEKLQLFCRLHIYFWKQISTLRKLTVNDFILFY